MRVCGTYITITKRMYAHTHPKVIRGFFANGTRLTILTSILHTYARNMQQSTCIALCSICKILSLFFFLLIHTTPHTGGGGGKEEEERGLNSLGKKINPSLSFRYILSSV